MKDEEQVLAKLENAAKNVTAVMVKRLESGDVMGAYAMVLQVYGVIMETISAIDVENSKRTQSAIGEFYRIVERIQKDATEKKQKDAAKKGDVVG